MASYAEAAFAFLSARVGAWAPDPSCDTAPACPSSEAARTDDPWANAQVEPQWVAGSIWYQFLDATLEERYVPHNGRKVFEDVRRSILYFYVVPSILMWVFISTVFNVKTGFDQPGGEIIRCSIVPAYVISALFVGRILPESLAEHGLLYAMSMTLAVITPINPLRPPAACSGRPNPFFAGLRDRELAFARFEIDVYHLFGLGLSNMVLACRFTIRSKLVVVWAIVLCCCVSCRLLLMILTRDFRLLDEGSDAIWYGLFLMMTILTAYASVRYDRVTRSIYWYTFLREQLQRNAADRSRNVNARILDACNDITTPGASGKELQEALISAFAQFDKRPPGVAGIPEFRALVDHVLESGTTKKRRLKFQRRSLDNDTKIVFLCDLIIAREADMTNVSVGFQIVGVSNVSNA